jgi:ubiquinone/menaquinone biosynthesis C-methylase UbiE
MHLPSGRLFQLTALPYDLLARASVWEDHCARMAHELPPGARRVLDLGCGPGNSTAHLRDAVGPGAIGMDTARAMLRRAHRRSPSLSLACADAGRLPVRTGSLDAVTFHSVLYLLPDRKAALAEVLRALRPGGRAVLLEPRGGAAATLQGLFNALPSPHWALTVLAWRLASRAYGRFTDESLRALLETSGLRVLKVEVALGGLAFLAVAERPGGG